MTDTEDRSAGERLHEALCGCPRGATALWDSWAARLSSEELQEEIARAAR